MRTANFFPLAPDPRPPLRAFHASFGEPPARRPSGLPLTLRDQLPQYIRKDAPVAERDEFLGRIDPHSGWKLDRLLAHRHHGERSSGTQPVGRPSDLEA